MDLEPSNLGILGFFFPWFWVSVELSASKVVNWVQQRDLALAWEYLVVGTH